MHLLVLAVAYTHAGGAGLVVLICAFLAASYPKPAYIVAAIVCLAMILRFLPKIIQEFQLYPGFLVVVTSAIMLALLAVGHFFGRSAS